MVSAQRRLQAGGLDPLADRRALAARNDQAIESLEVRRDPDLADFGAELAQDARMGFEAALNG